VASLEVGGPDAIVPVPGPDQVAVVPEDIRRRLARAVLFRRCIRVACKWSHEEVAFLDPNTVLVGGVGWDDDVEAGRGEVRAGLVLPVRSGESEQNGQCQRTIQDGGLHDADESKELFWSDTDTSIAVNL